MPKSHKRKNAGVGIDFKRAKHKVGRKLPAARNATDTTIKSGTLTLTQQSLAADRTGQAVTERNLTLKVVELGYRAQEHCVFSDRPGSAARGWGGCDGRTGGHLGPPPTAQQHALPF